MVGDRDPRTDQLPGDWRKEPAYVLLRFRSYGDMRLWTDTIAPPGEPWPAPIERATVCRRQYLEEVVQHGLI